MPEPIPGGSSAELLEAKAGPSAELGDHRLLDCYDCADALLRDAAALERTLTEAAEKAGARVVKAVFHTFSPHGASGVVVIAESHLAIHTWPERGFAAIDLFTCAGPALADRLEAAVLEAFAPARIETQRFLRGRS